LLGKLFHHFGHPRSEPGPDEAVHQGVALTDVSGQRKTGLDAANRRVVFAVGNLKPRPHD
jgi:hypothetical protein